MSLRIIDALTPINHGPWRDPAHIQAVCVHITDGDTAESAINWFRDPASQVSAHYVVSQTGGIYRCVPEDQRAWANGVVDRPDLSHHLIRKWVEKNVNPNEYTVSIEMAGRPGQPWPMAQQIAVRSLIADICRRRHLPFDRSAVIGHYQIDSVNRPNCPDLTDAEWAALLAPGPGDAAADANARMEAQWQARRSQMGPQRFAAHLDRPYYVGPVLVCRDGVLTPDGPLDEQGRTDDLVTYWAGVLQRY